MTTIALLFLTPGLEGNALRDLSKVQVELGAFSIKRGEGADIVARMLGVGLVDNEADVTLVYSAEPITFEVRKNAPENSVFRDFSQTEAVTEYSVNVAPPALRPQGRDGPSMTQIYLNRAHPRGKGISDPFVTNNFG